VDRRSTKHGDRAPQGESSLLLNGDVRGTKTSLGTFSADVGPRDPGAHVTAARRAYSSLEALVPATNWNVHLIDIDMRRERTMAARHDNTVSLRKLPLVRQSIPCDDMHHSFLTPREIQALINQGMRSMTPNLSTCRENAVRGRAQDDQDRHRLGSEGNAVEESYDQRVPRGQRKGTTHQLDRLCRRGGM
jgi:hypothetical protein